MKKLQQCIKNHNSNKHMKHAYLSLVVLSMYSQAGMLQHAVTVAAYFYYHQLTVGYHVSLCLEKVVFNYTYSRKQSICSMVVVLAIVITNRLLFQMVENTSSLRNHKSLDPRQKSCISNEINLIKLHPFIITFNIASCNLHG